MVAVSSTTPAADMSKLSFRARALDPSKPMPVYLAEELPDLPDYSAINRAVPQMPTGMQKEEECEHHLQRAICTGLIIPTPEVTYVPEQYNTYPSNYKQPRQLIHMQPFTMEQEIPDYDMDTDDERWLQVQKPRLDLNVLKFEEMMDRLEKSSGQTVVTLAEAKALLKEDDELTIAVYDYWLNKRLNTQHPLIAQVRTEHRGAGGLMASNNPYLAFRRRTEKMQTRKNRKNDEYSYEKMLKLRRDLLRAVTLLELVKRREKCKREYLHLTVEVFEKRWQARDYSGAVKPPVAPRPAFTPIFHNHNHNQSGWTTTDAAGQSQQAVGHQHRHQHHVNYKTTLKDELLSRRQQQQDKRQYKKRKHKSRGAAAASSDDDRATTPESAEPATKDPLEGPYAFRRKKLCNYLAGGALGGSRLPLGPESRFARVRLSDGRQVGGLVRKRVGRGGRVILDRAWSDDQFWRGLNFSVLEPPKLETEELPETNPDRLSTKTDDVGKTDFSTNNQQQEMEDVSQYIFTNNNNKRDLYRCYRPKTPDYEPICHLLPPDLDYATEPFQLEFRPLEDDVVDLLADSSIFSTELDLAPPWPTPDRGPPGPIFEDYVYADKKTDTLRVSRITITDDTEGSGGGDLDDDDQLMVAKDEMDSSEDDDSSVVETNGMPMGKIGFEADV